MARDEKIENNYYVSDERYHNDSIMTFFYELIRFLGNIRCVLRRSGNNNIDLVMDEETYPVNNIGAEAVSEYLVWIFFLFYNERANYKEIRIRPRGMQDIQSVSQSYQKNPKIHGFRIDNMTSLDVKKIEKIMKELEATFIEERLYKHLLKLFQELKYFYEHAEETSLWRKSHISKYLRTYYNILSCFLCENEFLEAEGIVSKILVPTLNLGIIELDSEENCKAGMTMPVVLYAMSLLYDKIDEFLLIEFGEEEVMENLLYNEIFLAKLHQMFRFYLIREEEGKLCHAALPAFKKTLDRSIMGVTVRDISTYNSFQGIRELRLADKILFEIRQRFNADIRHREPGDNFIYHIIILGDIVKDAMNELLMYIRKQIELKEEYMDMQEILIQFKVFTMRKNQEEDIYSNAKAVKYVCEFCEYESQLLRRSELKMIIEKGDLIFFLDNCDLYRTEVDEIEDLITFKQYISFGKYNDYKKQNQQTDFVLDGKFMDLYHTLTMYAWRRKIGFLRKKAKEDLVKFIRNEVESRSGKTAYIYISDIGAFNGLTCVQENIVRVETYNQKEIGIIRFTNCQRQELPVFFYLNREENRSREKLLVFNIWQVIKHTVLNQKVNFERMFLKKREKNVLDQIYIALDYSKWYDSVRVSYYCRDKKSYNRENIELFINIFIQNIFGTEEKDMYQKYLKKVLISILYGAAKSVEDLLFVYILKEKENLIGEFKWRGTNHDEMESKLLSYCEEKYDPIIEFYYNLNCKYSLKENYWELMGKFDNTGMNILDQYMVFETIKKSSQVNSAGYQNGVIEKFIGDILNVCETVGYKDSVLYRNCIKMKENDFWMM